MNEQHLDPPEDDDCGEEDIEYPEDFDADYGDWLYECWKDKHLDEYLAELEQDQLSDYEKLIEELER